MTFNGNAKVSEDAEKGKVLKLDGSDGTYAEFPKGLFDGRNKLTVQMDVKSEINKNQFTFAFGQNSTKYYFLKYNNSASSPAASPPTRMVRRTRLTLRCLATAHGIVSRSRWTTT